MRHLAHFLAQIDWYGLIDAEWVEEDEARTALTDARAETEHYQSLIFTHNPDHADEQADQQDD
jgi:hypothetical protein